MRLAVQQAYQHAFFRPRACWSLSLPRWLSWPHRTQVLVVSVLNQHDQNLLVGIKGPDVDPWSRSWSPAGTCRPQAVLAVPSAAEV